MTNCHICKKSMDKWIESEKGEKFCSDECFKETWPKCHACQSPMQQWQENENGLKFCSDSCSMTAWPKCSICSKHMDQWITDEDGNKFCSDKCFSQTFPVCDCCGKKMKEWTTYEDGNKYCSEECSKQSWPTCAVCNSPMNQWRETENGEKYCSEGCISTTWPKCDVCSEPMQNWSETSDGKRFCSTKCAESLLPTCDCCGIPMQKWYENNHGLFCSNRCSETEQKCKDIVVGLASAGAAANATQYAENVVLGAERGHGFAAEKANHLFDKVTGKDAELIGGDNVKNGADRLVDGIEIQTKYCRTGSKCVEECFDDGKFRYLNSNGVPMQIEVPSDKYDAAIQSMKNRISKGQIPGITDPNEAENIIRKGSFTYEQARNIAKFGTIESITYDAVNGAVVAVSAMGLSATVTFAYSVWSGEDLDTALQQACYSGLKVGGVVWVSGILSAQLGRTGLESALRSGTDVIVKQLGSKTSALIANSLSTSGKAIYGAAAMNNVSKLMRGNIVTAVATTVVISSVDIYRIFDGTISGGQLFKNVTTTAASVGAGTAGYFGTIAAASWAFGPIGGIAGAIVGGVGAVVTGSIGSNAANAILDEFIEDDAEIMFSVFKEVLTEQAANFLLNETEINDVSKKINNIDFGDEMRNMYSSSNRKSYSVSIIKPIIVRVVADRDLVILPSNDEILSGTRKIIEQL